MYLLASYRSTSSEVVPFRTCTACEYAVYYSSTEKAEVDCKATASPVVSRMRSFTFEDSTRRGRPICKSVKQESQEAVDRLISAT